MQSEQFNQLIADLAPYLVAVAFFFIFMDARARLSKNLEHEWSINSRSFQFVSTRISTSLSKLYGDLASRNKYQFAEGVAMELLRDAALFFKRPSHFFVRMRSTPADFKNYFEDQGLILFMQKPRLWTDLYHMKTKKGFKIRKSKTVDDDFVMKISSLIDIYKSNLNKHHVGIILE
jgi:hypothetical protein